MRKYAVDVIWGYGRSYEVYAENREEAKAKVDAMISKPGFDPLKNGFEQLDCPEMQCAGASNDNGEITYSTTPFGFKQGCT